MPNAQDAALSRRPSALSGRQDELDGREARLEAQERVLADRRAAVEARCVSQNRSTKASDKPVEDLSAAQCLLTRSICVSWRSADLLLRLEL